MSEKIKENEAKQNEVVEKGGKFQQKKETPFDRMLKAVGMKGIMGFVLGSSFVMLYDGMVVDAPAKKAISEGARLIEAQKKEIEALKERLKGCESACRGESDKVSEEQKREALSRSKAFMRGTTIVEALDDGLSGRYVRLKTANNTPLYYDPVSKYLIVGLLLDTRNPVASSKAVKEFTDGAQQ